MPAETLVASLAAQSFSGLLANLASHYLTRKTRSFSQAKEAVTVDLRHHFEATYDRCINVKTIINDAPVNMLGIYVDQRFKHRGEIIDQYGLIDRIRSSRSVIITGTGGGGKSMFMRYLWLSFFEKSDGKIPLFFDLRQVNTLSHNNFVDYLYHSILQTRSTISQKQFESAIAGGEVVIFLDGFDEISLDRRHGIELQIIKLKENNPRLTLVVTSRPDERFNGWQQFDNVEVLPLSENDVSLLVDRAVYDEVSKSRLLKRIKGGLYKTHGSFLSNPLLAYMMLLTIARNPDIPTKMHAFYEMAFDALYHRHDTSKGGYVREFHSKSDKQQFIKYLSYFCLITYHDQRYEATEADFLDYINKAVRFDGSDADGQLLLKDMTESVCLIKRDGLTYSFIHRSFQEYFAALCICRYASRNLEKLFGELSNRYNDQVLRMVYDINPDLFREKYLIPIHARHKRYFDKKSTHRLREEYLSKGNLRFEAKITNEPSPTSGKRSSNQKSPSRDVVISLDGSGEIFSLIQIINKIAPEDRHPDRIAEGAARKRAMDRMFFLQASALLKSNEIDLVSDGGTISFVTPNGDYPLNSEWIQKFRQTYMYDYIFHAAKRLKGFISDEMKQYSVITSSFDEYF